MHSPVEQFLIAFHARQPGATAEAFGALRVQCAGREYASSYELLASAVPGGGPAEVLDLACGDGFLLSLLAARAQPGLQLVGIDMSPAELAKAAVRLPLRIQLHEGRAQRLPFEDARFDAVLCHLALMLMDDAPAVLAEIARVAKPHAVVAAIVGAPAPPSLAFDAYLKLVKPHRQAGGSGGLRFGDARFGSAEGIRELLAGFDEVRVEDVRLSQRLTPAALWGWFLRMYDLHLLEAGLREQIRRDYLAAVAPACEADGKLEFPQALRYVECRVRAA